MRPVTDISAKRLSVPLTMMLAALVSACAAYGVAQVARAKLDETVSDVAALKAAQLPQAVEMQHVKDRLDGIEQGIDRLEHHFGTK